MAKKHTNQIGAVVRQTRGAASLRTFAELAGVSHTHIRNWETGRKRPPLEAIKRLLASRSETIRQMARLLLGMYRAEIDALLDGAGR